MQIILNRSATSSPQLNLQWVPVFLSMKCHNLFFGKPNIDHEPTGIEHLRPTRNAYINPRDESHVIASDWLLWLNQKRLLVESDPASLGTLLPPWPTPQEKIKIHRYAGILLIHHMSTPIFPQNSFNYIYPAY